jgi:hypothetical protein
MTTYVVTAVPGGWRVLDDKGGMPLMFLSGAKAEAKARELAALSRRFGEGGQVRIFTRDGRLATAPGGPFGHAAARPHMAAAHPR